MSDERGVRETTMRDLETRYGPKSLAAARTIDLQALVPTGYSFPADTPPPAPVGPLVRRVLDDFLADNGNYVFRGGVAVLIHQPGMVEGLANLKLRAIKAEIERRAKERLAGAPTTAPSPSRRLESDAFQRTVGRAGKRAVFPLDLADILLNTPGGSEALPDHAKRIIAGVLDDYLQDHGYYAWPVDSRVLVVLPHMPRGLGRLKRDAIAMEIRRCVEEDYPDLRGQKDAASRRAALAEPQPPAGRAKKPTPADQKLWDQAVETMAEKLWPGYDMASLTVLPAHTVCRFLPIWRLPNHMLTGYLVQVRRTDSQGRVLPDEPVGSEPATPGALADSDAIHPLDLPMLAQAIAGLEAMEQGGQRAIVFLPVHHRTLARPRFRRLFLEMCSRLSETGRHLLVIELVDLPTDLAVNRLDELIHQLRPFCRAVVVRVSLSRRDFKSWRGLGLHAVGVDMEGYAGPEHSLMQAMDGFLDAANPWGLKTYAHGLVTRSLTVAAIASGFDYVAGPAVAPAVPAPHGVRNFQVDELYDSLAAPATMG